MKTELTETTVNEKGVAVASVKTTVEGEDKDCTVRALAAATGSSYEEAHRYAKEVWGRENNQGVYASDQINHFLKDKPFGKTFKPIGDKEYLVELSGKEYKMRLPKTYYNNGGEIVERTMTLKTLLERYLIGTFYIIVRKHAFVVKDGIVIGNKKDGEALRRRLLFVFKVEEL